MPYQRGGPAGTTIRAERFRAALQTRVLGRAGLGERDNLRALFLERGTATLRPADAAPMVVTGPAMGWFPWRDDMRLDLAAGAQGTHLLLGAGTLGRVLQHRPEEPELRFSAGRMAVLRLEDDVPARAMAAACFGGILTETVKPGPMAQGVAQSLLHILLVQFHRAQTRGQPGEGPGPSTLAAHFTALVEAHFRDRWTVARYALALGVSRDRLNDICQRAHGRSSARLIRDRLVLEARIYLESSSLTLDQIAAALGFASAAQFNSFFRLMEDRPPGRYRTDQRRAAGEGQVRLSAPYDWP